MPLTLDQTAFVAQALNQLALALLVLAGTVLAFTLVSAVGYWIEYRAWKDEPK